MKSDIFKYDLPKDRIAKYPPEIRGTSNLLVLNREDGNIEHKKYFNIPEYMKEGDVVVLNETKVLNTRTYFVTKKGRDIEVMFLNEDGDNWFVLIGGGRYVDDGDIVTAKEDSNIKIRVLKKKEKGYVVEILNDLIAEDIFEKIGHTPLPPYMQRADDKEDSKRYNTVFSKREGASAAPTASLNLTEDILKQIEDKGVKIVKVELRVGWGTFAPLREENIEDHKIHSEYIHVTQKSADVINDAKAKGKDIWAFGTTVMRTLESVVDDNKKVQPYSGDTQLYIYPGFQFKVVDHLITNFHQPDSTLILLVSAFAGIEKIKEAYQEALDNGYKFLSYGDSMLIL
jgi:S-adenosylmethionine:tRNA ribosyltransferase-isomerase